MALHIYNTLKKEKELFQPINPDRVTLYVCGPTVYNFIHIGNARPVVIFDVLQRWLKHQFNEVVYARNITDIDDKINKTAAENGETIKELSRRYTDAFHEDIAALKVEAPTIEPFATDHIPQIIEIIESLIAKGHAYEAEGHVLFHVPSMKDYGKLSGRSLEDMIAGARVEVAPYKKDPADFVLWKPSSDDQPGWDSPWGRGRPGWHIECSAMIATHLGTPIDIHGGGQDLIFPHHENEIAQGSCAHGNEYARYWMHNGYITVSGTKMSKSLGNFFTVRDLLQGYQGEVLRYALLNAHYRSPLDWSEQTVNQCKAGLDRLYTALRDHQDTPTVKVELPEPFVTALDDDLNTPQALSEMHHVTHQLNKASDTDSQAQLKSQLLACGEVLGLLNESPERWFRWSPEGSEQSGLTDEAIETLIDQRLAARKNKDFATADQIRDDLKAKGVELEDYPGGTRWQRS